MDNISFRGQKADETVKAVFRKSMLAYWKQWLLVIAVLVLSIWIGVSFSSIVTPLQVILFNLVVLPILILRVWYFWSRNLFIITNLRVIVLEQNSFFHRDLKEAYLTDVCQVSAHIEGLPAVLFHYGNVLVQTEAELWLEEANYPYEVKQTIYDVLHKNKLSKPTQPSSVRLHVNDS